MARWTRGTIAVLLAALAGCSAGQPASESSSAVKQDFGPYVVVPEGAEPTPYPPVFEATDAHLGLPESRIQGWKAKEKITPPQMSFEEKVAYSQDIAEKNFRFSVPEYTGELPKVEITRFYTEEEIGQNYVNCVRDKGFPAVWTGDPRALVFELDEGPDESQELPFELAAYECDLKFPLDPDFSHEPTDAQLGVWYDYLIEAYIPCLASIGRPYTVTPSSKEAWIASIRGGPSVKWEPEIAIPSNDARAHAACPVKPPREEYWGR